VLVDVLADFFVAVHHGAQGVRLATAWNGRQVFCGLMGLRTALHAHKVTLRAANIPLLPPDESAPP
jgi:hypothetical protein